MQPVQIYLDNNATSYLDSEVAGCMSQLQLPGLANPASQHRLGRQALHLLENARSTILQYLGAPYQGMDSPQVILTSGGTEANNLALRLQAPSAQDLVIVGAMEHPSLLMAAGQPSLCANPVRLLPGLASGRYDLPQLSQWLNDIYSGRDRYHRVALVSLMLANNETGVLNDLAAIVQLCSQYDVPVHSDITQAVGKLDFDMTALGVSSITLAAHKVHGPVGIGALVTRSPSQLQPILVGGGQQLGWRAGTEPVALAVGMAKTLEVADRARRTGVYQQVARLRDRFEANLLAQLGQAQVNGQPEWRLPQTSNIAFVGIDRQAMQMALDLAGVACSTGSACASGSGRPSPTLQSMGLDASRVDSSLRFSLSRMTTATEIDQAVEIIVRVARKLSLTR
ncbi:MAG: cysteine desulfurase [Pirellulaceae bacterium]|nr:cysteine desulfurase [Pirellulaceae bacterium]